MCKRAVISKREFGLLEYDMDIGQCVYALYHYNVHVTSFLKLVIVVNRNYTTVKTIDSFI